MDWIVRLAGKLIGCLIMAALVLLPITLAIEIGATDETPTLSVKKRYIARKRLA